MAKLVETIHAGAFIVSEAPGFYSRDEMTVAVNQDLKAGQIAGAKGVPANITASAAADAGNTGNGTITLDATAPVAAGALDGKYRAVCVAVAANSGTFLVTDPKGVEIGRVVVGATFNNQVKFVVNDGATDFAVGDAFTITVGRESVVDEQVVAWDPAATDGSQIIVGLPVYPIKTGATATGRVAMLRRVSEVRGSDLTWPAAITAADKAAGIEQLRKLGIIIR